MPAAPLDGPLRRLFARFALITAQDAATARHLQALGARSVRVTGSLKAAAPPLAADPVADWPKAREAADGRRPWLSPRPTPRMRPSPWPRRAPPIPRRCSSSPRATPPAGPKSPPASEHWA
jgi:hypothetical protein